MRLGFAGLGRMGSQMVEKFLEAGHEVVVDNRHAENTDPLVKKGAESYLDHKDLATKLGDNPIVWLSIQHNYVPDEVDKLLEVLPEGSIIVDGGNSRFSSSVEQGEKCAKKGIRFVDVGTSGGVWGIKNGFSMMVGGDVEAVETISPLLDILAKPSAGWYHFGRTGAGHFVKMVHNGVEYGVMQAFAEGFMLMHEGPFDNIDLGKVAEVWQKKSINESFLNSLVEKMLKEDPEFVCVVVTVGEKGEGRWTFETAKELGIDTPALAAALEVRRKSREDGPDWSTKFLAQLRTEFGGHNPNQKDART